MYKTKIFKTKEGLKKNKINSIDKSERHGIKGQLFNGKSIRIKKNNLPNLLKMNIQPFQNMFHRFFDNFPKHHIPNH